MRGEFHVLYFCGSGFKVNFPVYNRIFFFGFERPSHFRGSLPKTARSPLKMSLLPPNKVFWMVFATMFQCLCCSSFWRGVLFKKKGSHLKKNITIFSVGIFSPEVGFLLSKSNHWFPDAQPTGVEFLIVFSLHLVYWKDLVAENFSLMYPPVKFDEFPTRQNHLKEILVEICRVFHVLVLNCFDFATCANLGL